MSNSPATMGAPTAPREAPVLEALPRHNSTLQEIANTAIARFQSLNQIADAILSALEQGGNLKQASANPSGNDPPDESSVRGQLCALDRNIAAVNIAMCEGFDELDSTLRLAQRILTGEG